MPAVDPVMAVPDRLPLSSPQDTDREPEQQGRGPAPFGLRFAVSPITPDDKHKKSYYTVTVTEATHINQDGKVVVRNDLVQ